METNPQMLDFVKAMSDPHRLRIIGLLTKKPATREEIAARLNLSAKDSLNHLSFLEFVGAVAQSEGVFSLNDERLAVLAQEKLEAQRPSFQPPNDLDERSKKILKAHLRADGSIWQIPAAPKLQVILKYLIGFFEFDRDYTEREVNDVIRRFNVDTAGLRRDLIDANLLARLSNGSRYWRVKEGDQ